MKNFLSTIYNAVASEPVLTSALVVTAVGVATNLSENRPGWAIFEGVLAAAALAFTAKNIIMALRNSNEPTVSPS